MACYLQNNVKADCSNRATSSFSLIDPSLISMLIRVPQCSWYFKNPNFKLNKLDLEKKKKKPMKIEKEKKKKNSNTQNWNFQFELPQPLFNFNSKMGLLNQNPIVLICRNQKAIRVAMAMVEPLIV